VQLRRVPSIVFAGALLATGLALVLPGAEASPEAVVEPARAAETVVLTGAQVASWSSAPAVGLAEPWPSGALTGERGAHDNGSIAVPPQETGVDPDRIVAHRWDGERFVEVPVQVDERFPYFLANPDSDFGVYSATDMELTYEWDAETWRKTDGECVAGYPDGYQPTQDPVRTLDLDDEIAFQAADAGPAAPADALGPVGTDLARQEVAVVDPVTGRSSYVYLFLRDGGSTFDATNGYVRYERAADADRWIDRYSFADDDPERLGSSNTGYGPNLAGTVCDTDPSHWTRFGISDPAAPRASTDRFVGDGVTVSTDAYVFQATGRWMVRSLRVASAQQPDGYGSDLIDRWKGRAFQSSPDSTISLVGFEDEQVNWEANSALLGERVGPVRAIREVWGADSGTNVTKTEIFQPGGIAYRYRLRVHPIPPDGLYTSWDYNKDVAVRYFNVLKPDGVPIDGINDDVGNIDEAAGVPAFFDLPDPAHNLPLAMYAWEQVSGSGSNGSLVYIVEIENPTTLENAAVVPYYRDDACFDDGTGDDPVPRPFPGEASTDPRVVAAYAATASGDSADCAAGETQGAYGSHGVHFFFTGDTDNAFVSPVPTTELDVTWWQFPVPTEQPIAVGEPYAQLVRVPLSAVGVAQASTPAAPDPDPEPEPERPRGPRGGRPEQAPPPSPPGRP
jgi:hypothetical protein